MNFALGGHIIDLLSKCLFFILAPAKLIVHAIALGMFAKEKKVSCHARCNITLSAQELNIQSAKRHQ